MTVRVSIARGSKAIVTDHIGDHVLLDYTTVVRLADLLRKSDDKEISEWGIMVLRDLGYNFEPKFDVTELEPDCYEFTFKDGEKFVGTVFWSHEPDKHKRIVCTNFGTSLEINEQKHNIVAARKLS